jgi:hypothetical protein
MKYEIEYTWLQRYTQLSKSTTFRNFKKHHSSAFLFYCRLSIYISNVNSSATKWNAKLNDDWLIHSNNAIDQVSSWECCIGFRGTLGQTVADFQHTIHNDCVNALFNLLLNEVKNNSLR